MKAALVLVLLVIACQAYPGKAGEVPAASGAHSPEAAATRGGTLVLADWEAPSSLDPIHATTAGELRLASLLFSPLWGLDPRLQPYPDLLREVPSLADGEVRAGADGLTMTVDLKLRRGLRWSDGAPITADDLIFTVDSICAAPVPAGGAAGFDHIASQERRSDTEVVWHFGPRPRGSCGLAEDLPSGLYPAFQLLGPRTRLLPAHRLGALAVAAWGAAPFFQHPDASSGPFAYRGGVPGSLVELTANPHYADGGSSFRHAPALAGVSYRIYNGKAAMIAGLVGGEADLGFHLLPGDAGELKAAAGSVPIVTATLQGELLSPNHAVNSATGRPPPWVADPEVLRALDEAIDRPALNAAAFGGAASLTPGLFPAALTGYGAAVAPRRDLADARRILGGRRPAFTLLTVCDSAPRQLEQAELVRQWAEAGAAVTATCAPRAEFFAGDGPNARGAFDMALYSSGWAPDPAAWASLATGPGNWSRCQDPLLERDFGAGAATLDPVRRRTAYADAEAEWLRYRCTLPLYEWPSVVERPGRLHNFEPDPTLSTDSWNAADWWLG